MAGSSPSVKPPTTGDPHEWRSTPDPKVAACACGQRKTTAADGLTTYSGGHSEFADTVRLYPGACVKAARS